MFFEHARDRLLDTCGAAPDADRAALREFARSLTLGDLGVVCADSERHAAEVAWEWLEATAGTPGVAL